MAKKKEQGADERQKSTGAWVKTADQSQSAANIEWCGPNAAAIDNAVGVSWSARLGSPIFENYAVPGIASVLWTPTLGAFGSEQDVPNVTFKALKSILRKHRTGSARYDGPDLGMHILAYDSISYGLGFVRRALATMYHWNTYSKYTPESLLVAMGVDARPQFTTERKAALIDKFNWLVRKFNTILMPTTIPMISRHYKMATSIYKDHESEDAAQIIVPVPTSVYQFTITEEDPSGHLDLIPWTVSADATEDGRHEVRTLDEYLDQLDEMLGALYGSSDTDDMNADFRDAFDSKNILAFPEFAESEEIVPVLDYVMLDQLHNATILGYPVYEYCGIKQRVESTATGLTGYAYSSPAFSVPGVTTEASIPVTGLHGPIYFDMHEERTKPNIMLCSRLLLPVNEVKSANVGSYGSRNTYYVRIDFDVASEVVSGVRLFVRPIDNAYQPEIVELPTIWEALYFSTEDDGYYQIPTDVATAYITFDSLPLLTLHGVGVGYYAPFAELKWLTALEPQQLTIMNRCYIQGMWGLQHLGYNGVSSSK